MITGLDLFEKCLRHREELVDDYYCHDELIISGGPEEKKTPIMKIWTKVQDRITAAKVALNDGDQDTYLGHVKKLDSLLKSNSHVNYLEFTSFFPVMDVSFSMYTSLREEERVVFLSKLLKAFIEKRHNIYNSHGYSASTIQVRRDFEKHKFQGNFANKKIREMLEEFEFTEGIVQTRTNTFCFLDGENGLRSLHRLCESGATWYQEWSRTHQGKHADVLFRNDSGYFICEAKHVKEAGGGQDKQITELISFVTNQNHCHGERNIFYVSFLDGVYFNKFIHPRPNTKINQQKMQIEAALSDGPNYFINTYGLRYLLRNT